MFDPGRGIQCVGSGAPAPRNPRITPQSAKNQRPSSCIARHHDAGTCPNVSASGHAGTNTSTATSLGAVSIGCSMRPQYTPLRKPRPVIGSGFFCSAFARNILIAACDTGSMLKRVKKPSSDTNQLARQLVELTTQDRVPEPTPEELSRVMAAIGRKGGKIGGKRRMETMTPAERSAVARKAAGARWKKAKRS